MEDERLKILCPWCDRPISLRAVVARGQKQEESFTLFVKEVDDGSLLRPVTGSDLIGIKGLEKLTSCPPITQLGVYSIIYLNKDDDAVRGKVWVVEE